MKTSLIIAAIKLRCPTFSGAVAGAAEFDNLPEAASLPARAAYVIPLADDPGPALSENAVRQELDEAFAVVVLMDNTRDERGQAAAQDAVESVRAELWKALLGWRPEPHYNGIFYEGGELVKKDRARLWWRFDFAARRTIGPEDGYELPEWVGLPDFDQLRLSVDMIDPAADRNIQYPGPDDRIEHRADIDIPQS